MPSPRSAGLIVVVMAMTSLVGGASIGTAHAGPVADKVGSVPGSVPGSALGSALGSVPGAVPSKRDPATLTELRREAQQASKGIEDATKALVARQKDFDSTQRELAAKLNQLQEANLALAKVRKPLSALVEYIYEDPSVAGLGPLFVSGDAGATLRAQSDVSHLVAGQNNVVDDAGRLFARQEQLAAEAQELRAANLLTEAELSMEIDTLRKRSATLVKSLTQALTKMGVKVNRDNRGSNACDPTRIGIAAQYPNGLLPRTILCPLPQKGEELRADAAIAFADLNLAYKKRFGAPLCISDSYRSLGDQQAVYYQRPGLAAIPGKSNHGLGLAVDLCGGVQIFRSVQFTWLETNGKRYGWIHPAWAYSGPFEPWHWEYDPKIGSLL